MNNETSENNIMPCAEDGQRQKKCESERLWHVEGVRKEVKSVKLELKDYRSGVKMGTAGCQTSFFNT